VGAIVTGVGAIAASSGPITAIVPGQACSQVAVPAGPSRRWRLVWIRVFPAGDRFRPG
jgi:hypothetical protein